MDEHTITVELLRTPPDRFVAARKAKVAELRADGHRDLATAIGKLRRPSPVNWALNTITHLEPDVVARWADAADAGRAAQRATLEGRTTDLRDALAELRRRTQAVIDVAPSGAPVTQLPAALAAIAASSAATAALRAGTLGAETPVPDDLFGDVQPAPASSRSPRAKPSPSGATPAADGRAADERRDRLRARVADHLTEADVADRALAEASASLERSEQAVADAQEQFDAARAELDDAHAAQLAASEQAARAAVARDDAHHRLESARSELVRHERSG